MAIHEGVKVSKKPKSIKKKQTSNERIINEGSVEERAILENKMI